MIGKFLLEHNFLNTKRQLVKVIKTNKIFQTKNFFIKNNKKQIHNLLVNQKRVSFEFYDVVHWDNDNIFSSLKLIKVIIQPRTIFSLIRPFENLNISLDDKNLTKLKWGSNIWWLLVKICEKNGCVTLKCFRIISFCNNSLLISLNHYLGGQIFVRSLAISRCFW